MAIRRPSISSPEWLFQDFLYQAIPGSEERYLQVKWDGEVYTRVSQSFDYSDPPYVGPEQRGGNIVAQIDYTVSGSVITINDWWVDWRDEWPLRLAVNYITQCLYPSEKGFVIFVRGQEVYNQAGEVVSVATKEPYAFWVSEQYNPITNKPNDYLIRNGSERGIPSSTPALISCTSSVVVSYAGSEILVSIVAQNITLGTPLYWQVVGQNVNAAILLDGPTEGVIFINSTISYLKLALEDSIPPGGPFFLDILFFTDPQRLTLVETNTVEIQSTLPPASPIQLGAYINLWQYRNTDAIYPYAVDSGWNPVVRAANIASNAIPMMDKFYLLAEVQLNGLDSKIYFGNPAGFPAAAEVLDSTGTTWNTNTGSPQGTYVSPGNPDYTFSAWALKNTVAYMGSQSVDRSNLLLCVGGYLLSDNMDLAGATPAQATAAANQIVTLMNLCDAKGVDIDYEPVGIPCNPARMATLMSAIYTAVKNVNSSYEVHLTVIPSILQADPDLKIATALACKDFADQINVMTYDDPSNLGQIPYQPGNIPVYNHTGVARSVQSVQWFIDAGVPADKLGMGFAMYARNSASPGAAFNANNPVTYSQIVASANAAGQPSNSFPLGRYSGTANIQNPSPTGQSDYYSPLATAIWGFDSVDTIASKVQSSKQMGLRAVFAWQISNDYANPSSTLPAGDARANFALLAAARKAIQTP